MPNLFQLPRSLLPVLRPTGRDASLLRFCFFFMLLNLNTDPRDHSTCALTYEPENHWLRATWRGFTDPAEAMRGAEAYLRLAARTPCPLLLNDNSALRGPWFDSLDWLAEVWVPQAGRLGLRCVAHVLQADRHSDVLPPHMPAAVPFELQIFRNLAEAEEWLRQWRVPAAP